MRRLIPANRSRGAAAGGIAAAALALVAVLALRGEPPADAAPTGILATATTGGTYYPVGVAIATLTRQVLAPEGRLTLAAISSAGSRENLRLLREREAGFAILQALYGAWAWRGEGALAGEPRFEALRAVTALWPNVEHFVVRDALAPTGTIGDLAGLGGRRFSIGARYSGAAGSARHILSGLGIVPGEDFRAVHLGYGASADALQDRLIDGMNTPAGVPVGAVTRALASDPGLVILGFTDAQRRRANGRYADLWRRYTIAADTYPNQPEPVTTIAQTNFLAVHAALPDDAVHALTEALFGNLAFLRAFHAATREMTLDTALEGLPVPLHPGAARYFRERGLEPGEVPSAR